MLGRMAFEHGEERQSCRKFVAEAPAPLTSGQLVELVWRAPRRRRRLGDIGRSGVMLGIRIDTALEGRVTFAEVVPASTGSENIRDCGRKPDFLGHPSHDASDMSAMHRDGFPLPLTGGF